VCRTNACRCLMLSCALTPMRWVTPYTGGRGRQDPGDDQLCTPCEVRSFQYGAQRGNIPPPLIELSCCRSSSSSSRPPFLLALARFVSLTSSLSLLSSLFSLLTSLVFLLSLSRSVSPSPLSLARSVARHLSPSFSLSPHTTFLSNCPAVSDGNLIVICFSQITLIFTEEHGPEKFSYLVPSLCDEESHSQKHEVPQATRVDAPHSPARSSAFGDRTLLILRTTFQDDIKMSQTSHKSRCGTMSLGERTYALRLASAHARFAPARVPAREHKPSTDESLMYSWPHS